MNRRIVLILATTAQLLPSLPAAQAQTKELTFTFISTEASSNLKTAWQPRAGGTSPRLLLVCRSRPSSPPTTPA